MQLDPSTHGFDATSAKRMALAFCLTALLALGAGSVAHAQSEAVAVTSSTNADIVVVTLQPAEGGGYTRDGEPFTGGLVALENGSTYLVTLAADGTWTAAYQQVTVSVPLNAAESVSLTRLEDGNFALPDGQQVTLATRYTTPSGRTYGVEIGADGLPRPVFVPLRVTVDLGRQGTVELTRGEDLSWAIGDMAVASGDLYEGSANALTGRANRYRLTLEEGRWTAVYEADEVPIAGTELLARPREDARGYAVGEASLPASGRGDVSVPIAGGEATYHVWATEDGLAGARFDKRIIGPVYAVNLEGNAAFPTLSADDRRTPANELGTQVTAAGAAFPVGDLLDGGQAQEGSEQTLVEQVRAEMVKLRRQVRGLVDLANNDGLDQATLTRQLIRKWDEADRQVDRLFGSADSNDDSQPDDRLERVLSSSRIVGAFDALLEALETEDAFVQASAEDGGGVYAFAGLGAAAAQRAFAAREWSAEAMLGAMGDTRYGVALRRRRTNAKDTSEETQYLQAFAWSTTNSVWRASDVEVRGNATYSGSTLAADADGKMYSGDVALQVRFARRRVSGLVSNLMTEDGTAWSYGLGGDVVNISLPTATMNTRGQWTGQGDARLSYDRRAGGARDQLLDGARFQGRLLGTGEDAGRQAIGTWQLGGGNDGTLIAGGFGAVRGPDRTDPTQPLVDDVTTSATTVTRVAKVGAAGSNNGVLSEAQVRLDGSRYKALWDNRAVFAAGADGLAEARAAIRAASSPMVLSNADADRIIRKGSGIDGEGSLTAATFTGWTVSVYGAHEAFNEATKSSALTARTWFLENSNTLRVWPLVWGGGRDPITGRSYAPRSSSNLDGGHPVRNDWWDDRAYDEIAWEWFKFDIDLDTLFAEGYPLPEQTDTLSSQATDIFVPSGGTHVERARTEITRLRRVLGSVIALDSAEATDTDRKFTNDRRQTLFTQIQKQLTDEIFGGTNANLGIFGSRASAERGGDDLWTAHVDYPVNNAGQPQDSQLLADIDAVIAALQSQGALEAAFQSGGIFDGQNENRTYTGSFGGGYEARLVTVTAENFEEQLGTDAWLLGRTYLDTRANDQFMASDLKELLIGSRKIETFPGEVTLPISHIWNKAKARALIVTDTTDFARFGMWSGHNSRFAMESGRTTAGWRGYKNFYETRLDPEPFAYSPLEQVSYRGADDSAVPTGLTATYRGRSVATMHEEFMTADAEARVSWSDSWSAGTDPKIGELKLTISNIESRGGFDALRFGLRAYRSEVDGGWVHPRPGTYDIRALVFRADIRADSDQDNAVWFTNDDTAHENVEVVIDTLTGQPEWLDPSDFSITLREAAGSKDVGTVLYDNTGDMFTTNNSDYYKEVGHSGHPFMLPGSKVREAFDYFFTQGAGAGKMNVHEHLVDLSADVDGKFVGKSVDGPLGMIGTWALTGTNKFIFFGNNYTPHIVGSFGLEFVPEP